MYYDGLCLSMQIVYIDGLPLIKRDYSPLHTPAPHVLTQGERDMGLNVHIWALRKRCSPWFSPRAWSSGLVRLWRHLPFHRLLRLRYLQYLRSHIDLLNYSGMTNCCSQDHPWNLSHLYGHLIYFYGCIYSTFKHRLVFNSWLEHFPLLYHKYFITWLQQMLGLNKDMVLL